MPKGQKLKRNFTSRRQDLIKKIRSKEKLIMRSCNACIAKGVVCVIHRSFDKCARCHERRISCDLIVTFENGIKVDSDKAKMFAQIKKRKRRVQVNVKKIVDDMTELSRFFAIQEELKKKIDEMIARESQNLKKIDENEAIETINFFFTFEIDGFVVLLNSDFFDDTFSEVFKHSSNAF